MTTPAPTEIDALYVTLTANAVQFIQNLTDAGKAVDALESKLQLFATRVSGSVSVAINNLSAEILTLAGAFSGLTLSTNTLSILGLEMQQFAKNMSSIRVNTKNLTKAGAGLSTFVIQLQSIVSSIPADTITKFREVASGMRSIANASIAVASAPMGFAARYLNQAMASITAVPTATAQSLLDMSAGMRSIAQASIRVANAPFGWTVRGLNALAAGVASAVKQIPSETLTVFRDAAAGMRSIAQASTRMGAVNMATVTANAQSLVNWIKQLVSISPLAIANLTAITNYLNAAKGAGGKLPPIIGQVGSASSIASPAVGGFTERLRAFAAAANSSNMALTAFRFGLVGLAGFGIAGFAKFDDTLIKALARMRDFAQINRAGAEKDIFRISGSSITSTKDLAEAWGLLTQAGMNPQGALKEIENFAVASSMPMKEATTHIIDLQRSLNMIGRTADENVTNIKRITDAFVQVARVSGSTEEQMIKAFGGKFIGAMELANLDLEQGIALLGAYSMAAGKAFRAEQGGDVAARFVQLLTQSSVVKKGIFNLGASIHTTMYDETTGKLKDMALVLELLNKELGDMGGEAQRARLEMLGFGSARTVGAFIPIIQGAKQYKDLLERLGKKDGMTNLVADMIRKDFNSQLIILKNNVINAATVIGEILAPAMSYLSQTIAGLTGGFVGLNAAYRNLIVLSAALVFGIRPVIYLLTSLGSLLVRPFLLAGSAILTLGKAMWSLTTPVFMAAEGFWAMGKAAWSALSFVGGMFASTFSLMKSILSITGKAFLTFFKDLGLSIASGFMSIVAGIIPFFMSLVTWFFALSAGAAVVATVLIGISQLFAAVSAGAVAFWNGIRDAIPNMFASAAAQMRDFSNETVKVWENIKANSESWFDSVKEGIKAIAGFFWNFGENVIIIWNWINRNWKTISEDIGHATVALVENMAGNFKRLGSLLIQFGDSMWTGFWRAAEEYGRGFVFWFKDQWKNIGEDIGNIFQTVFVNLASNFATMTAGMAKYLFRMGSFDAEWEAERKKRIEGSDILWLNEANKAKRISEINNAILLEKEAGRKSIMDTYFKGLKGPFDNMPDMKTQFGGPMGLGRQMRASHANAMGEIQDAWDGFVKVWQETMGEMKHPLAGFLAVTEPLMKFLNLNIPTDAAEQFTDMLKKIFGKSTGGGLDDSNYAGKAGPGFSFKQISETRLMVGGPAAERLDYQQLNFLNQIASNTAVIANNTRLKSAPEAMPVPNTFRPAPIAW